MHKLTYSHTTTTTTVQSGKKQIYEDRFQVDVGIVKPVILLRK